VVATAQFVLSRPIISPVFDVGSIVPVVRVSPNPVASNSMLTIQTNLPGKAVFRLFDAKGRAIRLFTFERQATVSLQGLAAGTYAYALETDGVIKTGRVMVH
jgi:hypothetical protein